MEREEKRNNAEGAIGNVRNREGKEQDPTHLEDRLTPLLNSI
jgi:hypothetical protein